MTILIVLFLASLLAGQLGGISPFPGVVVYVHDIVLVLLLLFSVRKFRGSKLTKPILLFIAVAALSLFVNIFRFPLPEIGFGSLYLVRWSFYAALYCIVVQDKKYVHFWLQGLYIVGVGLGVIGLLQFFLYPDLRNLMYLGWDPHYYRLFSSLLDPNFAGILLVLTLLLGFGLWKKKQHNYLLIIGQIVAFVSLLLTYSRSSYAALAVAVLCFAAWTKQWKIALGIVAFAVLVFVLPRTSGSTLSLLRQDSSQARVGNWQDSLQLIAKAPLFGYGFDTLRYLNKAPSAIISKSASGLDSSILFVLATTGVFGFAAYIYLLIMMIRAGEKSMFYIVSVVAILVHSLFVNSLFYPWVMIWIWILTGAVICGT